MNSFIDECIEKTSDEYRIEWKNLHFVWIGGPLGEAQKEYLKIWAEINPDYEISVWYDSDYLYSYETNSLIKEAILKSQYFFFEFLI